MNFMKHICDIHSHIMPNFDDGSKSIKESIEMLKIESDSNVTDIFFTPHSYSFASKDSMLYYIKQRDILSSFNMNIYLGCEIFTSDINIQDNVNKIKNGIIPTMNETRYILIEFDVNDDRIADYVNYYIDNGFYPIIAHIERYNKLDINDYYLLKQYGAKIQSNLFDIVDCDIVKIKNKTQYLLRNQLIDFVGSDAHSLSRRPPVIKNGIEYINKNCTNEYKNKLLFDNAKKYLIKGVYE